MLNSRKQAEKLNKKVIIAPNEKIRIISSLDKRNHVDITNINGELVFNITYAIEHNKNIFFSSKESKE